MLALAAEEAAHYDREVTGDPVTIAGDALLLRRLIRNLLENARLHAGGASDIRVTRQDGGARLVIEDAGPGIPAEDRERIFEPFYRRREAGRGGRRRARAIYRAADRACPWWRRHLRTPRRRGQSLHRDAAGGRSCLAESFTAQHRAHDICVKPVTQLSGTTGSRSILPS